ncbi:aldo/keto reductase [Paeniglutamicibacter sp. NPDC012692]|uniref:aldo/keto reductase n=1 Tax=Paeniglutamicibacter sp. NPDC012692 TaxID=3364388 RepID=UPI0036BB64E0
MRESLIGLGFGDPDSGRNLGFGAAGLGNLYRPMEDATAQATLQAAYDSGARYFDTAPHYGLGLSESRLGEWLGGDVVREDLVISSKVGRVLEPNAGFAGELDGEGFAVPATTRRRWDPSEEGIRASIESTLLRLGTDYLDIVFLHDPDAYDLEEGIARGLPVLEKLRAEGLIQAIGAGTNSTDAAAECVRRADLDLVMLAGRYTLLEQPAAAELLPLCMERSVGIVNVGVYNSGLLASPVVPANANYNYKPAPAHILDRARALAAVAGEFGTDLPTAAVHFAMRHPSIVSVMLGASTPEQARVNAARAHAPVDEGLWDALVKRGLLDGALAIR